MYHPSAEERKDPKLYARNVRSVLSAAIKVPAVEASFTDKLDYHVHLGIKKPREEKKAQ